MPRRKVPAKPIPSAHRRAASTGYARGAETRLRIIHAAVELFGAGGYARTSTREIAARAGVNAPALQYYFKGKEGLYLACAEDMAERGRAIMTPALSQVRARLAAKPKLEDLIDGVCVILERAADFILMSKELEAWAKFMAWENIDRDQAPACARTVIDQGLKREVQTLLCDLVGRIIGKAADDAQTRIRVLTLGSQVSVFHATREHALHDIGWTKVDDTGLETIKSIIRRQTIAALRDAAATKK